MVEHLKAKQADTPKRDISHSVAQQRAIPDRNGYADRFAKPEYYPIRETGSVVQMYYAEDSKEPCVQASSGTFSPIVQRKIGMEYQTVGNGKNVFEYENDIIKVNKSHREILFTVPYEKDKEIAVTADGSDLEYVTPAVDTPEEAYLAGCAVARIHHLLRTYDDANLSIYGLRVMHQHETKNIQGYKKYNTGEDKRSWECTKGKKDYILMNIAETAHPQATVGIRMDKIVDLFSDLGGTKSSNAKGGNAKGSKVIKDASGLVTLGPTSSHLSDHDLEDQMAALRNALQKAWEAVRKTEKEKNKEEKDRKSLVGILAFLYAYNEQFQIIAGNPDANANAKNAMLVMNRTSLYDAYCKLSDEDQEIFEYIMNKVPEKVPKKGGEDPGGWLGVKSTQKTRKHHLAGKIILAGAESEDGWNALTVKAWVEGMKNATDLMNEDYDSVGSIENKNTDRLDAFNLKRSTDIGSQEGVDGMLVELRGLKRGVEYKHWGEIAWRVAYLTDYLNKRNQSINQPIKKQDIAVSDNMKEMESLLPQQMERLMQQKMLMQTPQQLQEQLNQLPNLQYQLTQLPDLEDQLTQRQNQMAQLQNQLSNLQDQLKNLKNQMTQQPKIKKQQLQIRLQLQQMRDQLPLLRDQLPLLRDQLPQIKRQMTQMKKQLLRQQMLQKRLLLAKEWLPNLEDQLPQLPDQLPNLEDQMKQLKNQIAQLENQIAQLPKKHEQLHQLEQLLEQRHQMKQMQKQLEQVQQMREQLEQVQQMREQLEQVQQMQDQLPQLRRIEKRLRQIEKRLPKIEEGLKQIEEGLLKIEKGLSPLNVTLTKKPSGGPSNPNKPRNVLLNTNKDPIVRPQLQQGGGHRYPMVSRTRRGVQG